MARFLSAGERELLGGAVVLASYPRSGNSLFRDVCERITGVVTGSDVRPDRALSRALTRAGLRGVAHCQQRVVDVRQCGPCAIAVDDPRGHDDGVSMALLIERRDALQLAESEARSDAHADPRCWR